MSFGIAVPGTVIPIGVLTAPGGAQGLQGVTGAQGPSGVGVPTGALMDYAGSSAPTGWLLCDGSAVSRTTYAALFTAISTTYGAGDGSTTFNVPDARGRVGIGAGAGTGLTNRVLAATGGEETHQLTTAELASHTHAVAGGPFMVYGAGASSLGSGTVIATASNTQPTGSDGAHNNMQPFVVLNKIIKT